MFPPMAQVHCSYNAFDLEHRSNHIIHTSKLLKISPLRLAIRRKEFLLLSYLLEHEVEDDLEEIIEEALQQEDMFVLSIVGPFSNRSLVKAAKVGHLSAVEKLIENGAQLDIPNDSGETALITSITHGHHSIAQLLLFSGASPNQPCLIEFPSIGSMYVYPLHAACLAGNDQIVTLLIQKGASLEYRLANGWSVLDCSLKAERKDVYGQLLMHMKCHTWL
ncbi:hypothetical protein GEMRC1_004823 [Eukaryota sp. GEM-RC1]